VIYCKFWELDTDHDFLIDKENLIKYGNHALTYRIVDRIFSEVSFLLYFPLPILDFFKLLSVFLFYYRVIVDNFKFMYNRFLGNLPARF
jgi:hypothetical protein